MPFEHFLKLVSTLKMLYGNAVAQPFFEKNIDLFYNLDYNDYSVSLNKKRD